MAAFDRFDDDNEKIRRTLITPEGVDLKLKLATAGQRAGAFTIDFLLLGLILFLFSLFTLWAGLGSLTEGNQDGLGMIAIIWMLGFFLLRNFYFIGFEAGRRSATLGKRWTGLRVVARDGGRLTTDAVIARNLMREIEIFLPLSFVGGNLGGGVFVAVAGFSWAAIFLFFPLFNRDRLRVGDIVAGTWVIHAPKRKLESDLASEGRQRLERFAFTDNQLAVYGEYELKTLERILREGNPETLSTVSSTIREKIGWPYGDDDYEFLSAYYAAVGKRLERGMLFGKRRADKFDDQSV